LDLKLAQFHPAGKVVMDAGSGFGVTLLCLAALKPRLALGTEVFSPMATSAQVLADRFASQLPVQTVRGSVHEFPFTPGSVDFIYCNEAISHFLDPDRFLVDSARILAPGGKLMICDGNNGANPATVAEVHEVWKAFEQGPAPQVLHGHKIETPYESRRIEMLGSWFPEETAETKEKLAWGTFGLHGDQIREKATAMLREGSLPTERNSVTTCPVDPIKGDHIENLMYPDRLTERLEGLGLSVKVYAHFGGAKSTWVELANRVLRAMTPLTLSRARSFKLVATQRG
ncbi:MAG: class I SAM-dependent methyltransferase, partial [Candidatus Eisenbacteria bacterium]|nr:class I SAM-dependent methyltransferase [Candidatus Eisenbacteria bacterium]